MCAEVLISCALNVFSECSFFVLFAFAWAQEELLSKVILPAAHTEHQCV